jgi:hypothetical protein
MNVCEPKETKHETLINKIKICEKPQLSRIARAWKRPGVIRKRSYGSSHLNAGVI